MTSLCDYDAWSAQRCLPCAQSIVPNLRPAELSFADGEPSLPELRSGRAYGRSSSGLRPLTNLAMGSDRRRRQIPSCDSYTHFSSCAWYHLVCLLLSTGTAHRTWRIWTIMRTTQRREVRNSNAVNGRQLARSLPNLPQLTSWN
jgi:hypothetical protein